MKPRTTWIASVFFGYPVTNDWMSSSESDRRELYKAVTRLIRLRQLSWNTLYEDALKLRPGGVGAAFNENFRKGKVSAANAALIAAYLSREYPDDARDLNDLVAPCREFREFLLQNRRLGVVEMLPIFVSTRFRTRSLGPEWREYPFEKEDPITFQLNLPHVYEAACALNATWDGVFPVGLQEPTDYQFAQAAPAAPWLRGDPFIKAVTQGMQTVTTFAPTEGERRRRRHGNSFVFLVGDCQLLREVTEDWEVDRPITSSELDAIARRFRAEKRSAWCVAQINAHGIGPYADDE